MVATTLLFTVVSFATTPVRPDPIAIRLSPAPGSAAHLVVPSGVAVPVERGIALTMAELFRSPARAPSTVALDPLPDARARAESVSPAGRPSCSL
ncbi:hypothetical protein NFI95_16380 [Acetobacteraceae bacterium KSS8]|uniref:Uncharacterized protein n=1 Tax=Endosaccharibacter trunci TaxID=2812733 RepID=A0ABT1WD57_9PROT|nr:hypothetical protein [Acetobacteraceae bacterium KSS8]